ncbi:dihydrodipicolinate synthase family protein [Halostella sp. JP-L12]|uniref:dihydrodipicolinate synthase family protein n=1 Tax=Halostella TaxID=1843185 RepID=UPI000EF76695|nr:MULTISPECIES: dihydrodipicolinate synthase family protein [Halostella]NHN46829.1 dihydrodipicolinate synthase family protein [Halostella sp. JP-L12]
MDGTGVPLVTPFTEEGSVDEDALRSLTAWVEDRGIDFLVPCGSTSEAPLLDDDERERVIAAVAEAADGPVLAGTGKESLADTLDATERAAEAGADAALVVTPHYFDYGQDALAEYYRDVADESPLPVYLYSVPPYTDVALDPETVGAVADHDNVAGIKDSSGDLARLQRTLDRVPDDFDVLVGNGSVYAPGLDAGAAGGVLAVANAAPERASEIYRRHRDGDDEAAREINRDLVELDSVLGERGIPAVKAAVRERGQPAGRPRRPFRPLDGDDREAVARTVEERT